jgi:proline dehydrogenase
MLRSFFGILSRSTWAQRTFSSWGFAKRLASRFIAGESSDEAIQAIRQLNERGIQATLDHLGENTTTHEEANIS